MARFELQLAGDSDFSSLADIGIKLFLPSFLHSFICPFLRADFLASGFSNLTFLNLPFLLILFIINAMGESRKTGYRRCRLKAAFEETALRLAHKFIVLSALISKRI